MFSNKQIYNLSTKRFIYQIFVTASIPLFYFGIQKPIWAQLSSDNTLGTQVNQSGNIFEITGGQQAGSNLFHSFQEFSVPTGSEAFFNNVDNINGVNSIIGRVTGGLTSNIDGLIRENYGANLILFNPSGINFGPNAQLNIGGSFLGSTASSVLFEDGTEFSAINPQSQITITVPLGLQMGENPAPINVEGTGHNLSVERRFFSPFTRGDVTGLKVLSGETLALIGGNVNLEGGTLTAEGGLIELGSTTFGLVNFTPQENGWTFSYQDIADFGDINLRSQALLDTSGINSGAIHLQGRQISVQNGSSVLIQNQGNQPAKSLKIDASEVLEVTGTNADGSIASNLFSEALNSGTGADIIISTPQLIVKEGALISTATFNQANGGQILINADDSVEINGFSPINPIRFSNITAATFGAGNAGNVTLSTHNLTALNGGNIASVTGSPFATGTGGNVTVNATESVELMGVTPVIFTPSQITSGSGSSGNAGSVTVNTQKLVVKDGGRVDASATATGDAGSVTINATESVLVNGTVEGSVNPSLIISSANILDETLRQILGLPDVPTGNSGNVTINTPQLTIDNGAEVTVRNDGLGNAGILEVNANSIFLNNRGSITAATKAGIGGNINLQVLNDLQMDGDSQISSDNLGTGDSGNLTIETGKLTIGDGGFISATTFGEGKGANVNIRATESVQITGSGFEEFQETFQASALSGTLLPTDRGTGIFLGTSGSGASGQLTIETTSLLLDDGAVIFNPTFTEGIGGNISIRASESVELIGSALQTGATPGSTGAAGQIEIDTGKLILRDGATIINPTLGDGAGGNVEITALESVELQNTPVGALLLTGIYTNTVLGSGRGGDIRIDTGKLSIRDGVVGSNTGASLPTGVIPFGGVGGNVIVNATESVEIAGIQADTRFPSGLGTTGFSQSPSGDVTLFTKKLIVSEGADVSSAALGAGQGGTVNINASESIELIGTTVGDLTIGGLSAASGRANLPELEATGASGDIKVTTKNLIVRDGARIDVQSLGSGDAGNLEVVADSIFLNNQGAISANSTGIGNAGNIKINADSIFLDNEASISAELGSFFIQNGSIVQTAIENNATESEIAITSKELVVQGGANISTATFTNKRGANIAIDVSDSLQVIGASPTNPTELSFISSSTFETGDSGDVNISTGKLSILNGGIVGAGTFGAGNGGDITINATESVEVIGIEPTQLLSSVLGGSTLNAGNAGNVIVNTPKLIVKDGGRIDSSTAATGHGGNININASESVEVSGAVPETHPVSQISSSGIIEDEFTHQLFGLPLVPSGDSGNVTINTPRLNISDRSVISVRNEGSGNAGILEVWADRILLDNQGSLSAATTSGEGGNISLRTNSLLLDGNSELSATAEGTGNGGNIAITNLNADNFVVLEEGSKISANAFQGRGGNIQIEAKGVFICSDCQITASSDLGVEGIVEITTPETENNLEFINLPQEVVQPEEKVATVCSSEGKEGQSQFIVTGRGGLPPRPTEPLNSDALVSIEPPSSQSNSSIKPLPKTDTSTLPPPARGWYVNTQGLVVLAEKSPEIVPYDYGLTKQECYGN
ncbi:MAG: hypothetical protein GFH25_541266n46 [Chloroflexi bacterium AL-N10]|nr:hypothetical protein [Chloroflexi bacterium AL-N10]NOK92751.1 hypothetical protein [Chloroflexi bacterium AL-N15]